MEIYFHYALYAVYLIVGLMLFFGSFYTVSQQDVAIIERFGKFSRVGTAGLNFKIPLIESVVERMSLKILELKLPIDTKTKDNVFVKAIVSVQYNVLPGKVMEAYYKLTDPEKQISSFVYDIVRGKIPGLTLDQAFEQKDDIAQAIKTGLEAALSEFGYEINKALVVDIDPDAKVKEAMNEINAAQRQRVAANEKGEAEKVLKVKAAEADAESKKLQGEGIANQRAAIMNGLKKSVEEFKGAVGEDVSSEEVMKLVLLTQYFDTLKEIGANSRTNTMFLPSGPGGMAQFTEQLVSAMTAGNALGKEAGGTARDKGHTGKPGAGSGSQALAA